MTREGLEDFLDRLAAATAAPGAGAATALAAAASAAIVTMVSRVTARRTAPSDDLTRIEGEAEALRARLTALVQHDADAYAAVIAARRLPDDERPRAVRAALATATEVPVEIAGAAERILTLCDRLAPGARASTVSDLAVAVTLAAAALEGATLTARVNLRDLDDPAFVSRTNARLAALVESAAVTRQRLGQVVAARTGIPA